MDIFSGKFRCITIDQRNANGGESSGPIALDDPDVMYRSGRDVWAPELLARRPDLDMTAVTQYLHILYRVRPDFVYSVSRDFARSCQTPMLVLPDETPAHPHQSSVDVASLCPNAEITVFP